MEPTTTATAASLHWAFALAFYFFRLLIVHQTCKQALDWVEGGFEIRVCLQPKPSTYFPSFWHTSRLTSVKLDWARLPIRAVSGPVGTSRNYDADGNAGKRLNTIGAFFVNFCAVSTQLRPQITKFSVYLKTGTVRRKSLSEFGPAYWNNREKIWKDVKTVSLRRFLRQCHGRIVRSLVYFLGGS